MNESIALERARQGHEDGWRWLLKRHEGAMQLAVNRAVYLGADEQDAWSHCHEALLRCVRCFDQGRGLKFVTYFWTALRNVHRRAFRGGAIARTHYVAVRKGMSFREIDISCCDCAVEAVERPFADEVLLLRRQLELLPARERNILRRRMRGETLEAIGREVGLSKERVRQVQRLAIEKLREALCELES